MMKDIVGYLVICIFAAWFIISVLNQHQKLRKYVSRVTNYDICSLIPVWTFFAPNPGRTDIYLLYRDQDDEGEVSAWRQVSLMRRSTWSEIWSPERRINKGIVDLSSNFTKDADNTPQKPVSKRHVVGFPYLLLLNYVCHKPVDFKARMRQFALARTNGHGTEDNPDVIFLSAFHIIQPIT